MKNRVWIGAALCLLASMSWGAMFPVAESALKRIDPFYFTCIRYASVSVLLAILLFAKEGKASFRLEGKGKHLLFYGIMAFTVYNICMFWGQKQLGASGTIIASLTEALMPMISVMFVWATQSRKPPTYTIASTMISLAGAILVVTNGEWSFFMQLGQQIFPLFLLLIAVLGWVIYTGGGEKFAGWSILRYSTLTCILGTLVSCIVVGLATAMGLVPAPDWHTVFTVRYEMAFMILLPGLAALLSWNAGIQILSPVNGILFINFVPITTLLIMAFQGYHISMYELYGTAMVVFALVCNNLFLRKTEKRALVAVPSNR